MAMRRQYDETSCGGEPADVVEGYMQYLYDETGRRTWNMFAGTSRSPAAIRIPNSSSG